MDASLLGLIATKSDAAQMAQETLEKLIVFINTALNRELAAPVADEMWGFIFFS
ncbi:MAG: hypothetical protein MK135_08690 [Polyangiaceae bacterium]|nr:hypothetical protein [Polyangiaceae bacterium]